jgi:hypothetical protein
LFNKGLSQVYLGRTNEGVQDMEEARGEKATEEHNVIDDAIIDRGEGYTVFSIVSLTLDLGDWTHFNTFFSPWEFFIDPRRTRSRTPERKITLAKLSLSLPPTLAKHTPPLLV